jgi:hypothetical protein
MRAKIRLKVKRHEKTKKSEIKKWVIGKLRKKEIQAEFIKYSDVEDVYEMWNTLKQGINEADGKIIGKEKTPQKIVSVMKNVK